jgi:hypothetical protein
MCMYSGSDVFNSFSITRSIANKDSDKQLFYDSEIINTLVTV